MYPFLISLAFLSLPCVTLWSFQLKTLVPPAIFHVDWGYKCDVRCTTLAKDINRTNLAFRVARTFADTRSVWNSVYFHNLMSEYSNMACYGRKYILLVVQAIKSISQRIVSAKINQQFFALNIWKRLTTFYNDFLFSLSLWFRTLWPLMEFHDN